MSTKTLRKRIALVAVASVGAGLLSLAAIPAANATVASAPLNVVANGATSSQSQGIVAGSTGVLTGTSNTLKISTTGVLAVKIGPALAAGSTGAMASGDIVKLTVTGAYISSAASGATTPVVGSDQKSVTITGADGATPGVIVVKGFTAGTAAVLTTSWATAAAPTTFTTGVALTVTPVLAGTINAYDAGNSLFQTAVNAGSVSGGALSNTDGLVTATGSAATYSSNIVANGSAGYFGYAVKDSNGNALSSPTVVATATGGCTLNYGADTAGSISLASNTDGSAASYFRIDKPTANVAANCPVTISVNGANVATRSFTFVGQAAKIKITASGIVKASASATNANVYYFDVQDAVGNSLDGITVAADSTYYNSGLTSITGSNSAPYGGGAADGALAAITCVNKGSYKMRLKVTAADTSTIKSDEFTIVCAGSPVNYSATLDKTTYAPGDIATVTISAKDSAGNATYDAATAGSGVSLAGSNLTAVTTPAAADTFTSGNLKYKFVVGSTEGSYQLVVDLPAYDSTTYNQAALTLPYTIKASSASVTNAEVLAAIVKLIASINKQIAALQKALKK